MESAHSMVLELGRDRTDREPLTVRPFNKPSNNQRFQGKVPTWTSRHGTIGQSVLLQSLRTCPSQDREICWQEETENPKHLPDAFRVHYTDNQYTSKTKRTGSEENRKVTGLIHRYVSVRL